MKTKNSQNPEQRGFFINNKKRNMKGPKFEVNKISINDIFQEESHTLNPFAVNKSIRINTRKSIERQNFINSLSLNKLKSIDLKLKRHQDNRPTTSSSMKQKRKTHSHIQQLYKQIQSNSFCTSIKEQITRFNKRHSKRAGSLNFEKQREQKQCLKRESMSVGMKYSNHSPFLKTMPSLQYSSKGNITEENSFKDWSVYILRRQKMTIEAKPLKLHQSDIKINTTFKFSIRPKIKVESFEKRRNPICGWDDEKDDDF